MKAETLQVPDASLYYEVRGSGPVLLMIPGGPMDADGFKEIAHEPPVSELLPDAARYHALNEQVGVTYRSDGTFAALQMFTKGVGFGNDGPPPPAEQTPEAAAAGARMGANLELFAGRLIPIIGNYEPDLAALQHSSTRIVVGVGDESTPEQMVYQTAHALAERLGSQPAQFPGGHGGFGSHPDGFAARLREVLAAAEG